MWPHTLCIGTLRYRRLLTALPILAERSPAHTISPLDSSGRGPRRLVRSSHPALLKKSTSTAVALLHRLARFSHRSFPASSVFSLRLNTMHSSILTPAALLALTSLSPVAASNYYGYGVQPGYGGSAGFIGGSGGCSNNYNGQNYGGHYKRSESSSAGFWIVRSVLAEVGPNLEAFGNDGLCWCGGYPERSIALVEY